MIKNSKSLGQYFTPIEVADFMVSLISKSKSTRILEPCAGEGVFLNALTKNKFSNIKAIEVDSTLKNKSDIKIDYCDFLDSDINDKYDIIIGNPPYVRWKNIPKEMQEKLKNDKKWKDKLNGLSDLLYYFIYFSIEKLNKGGELIFITPLFWTSTFHSRLLRKYLSEVGKLDIFITFNEMRIFEGVSTNILIFKFVKEKTDSNIRVVHVKSKDKLTNKILDKIKELLSLIDKKEYIEENFYEAYSHGQFINSNPWRPFLPKIEPIISSIETACLNNSPMVEVINNQKEKLPLSNLLEEVDIEEMDVDIGQCKKVRFLEKMYYLYQNGITKLTDFDNPKKEQIPIHRYTRLGDVADIGNGMVSGLDKAFQIEDEKDYSNEEKKHFIKVIKAKNLNRYFINGHTPYIFMNTVQNEKELNKMPKIKTKLLKHNEELKKRYSYNKVIPYWHWVFPRNQELIENSSLKIIVPCKERVDARGYIRFGLVDGDYYASQDTTVIVKKTFFKEDLKYLLAILNSKIIFTWLKYKGLSRGGVLEFSEKPLSMIPIRLINWNNKEEVRLHNKIVELISDILSKKELNNNLIEIENLLGKLYGLRGLPT